MISYEPLWETMRQKGVSQYALIHTHGVSPAQITRLKRNGSVRICTAAENSSLIAMIPTCTTFLMVSHAVDAAFEIAFHTELAVELMAFQVFSKKLRIPSQIPVKKSLIAVQTEVAVVWMLLHTDLAVELIEFQVDEKNDVMLSHTPMKNSLMLVQTSSQEVPNFSR